MPKTKQTKLKPKPKLTQKVCGIDDSGRGPVIGPMVLAGVMIPKAVEKQFAELGVKDSKRLTPRRRVQLAHMIKQNSSFSIIVIHPKEITSHNHGGVNLNKLEAIKSAHIINELSPDIAIIDCPSPNIPNWTAEVKRRLKLKPKPKLIVEHKADVNHVSVAAGSILAKVTRDREIEKIQSRITEKIGSGYTSDPITRKFLKTNWEKHPGIFRETWQTWQKHKKGKNQKKLDDFGE